MLFRAQVRDTAKTILAAALQAAGAAVTVEEDAPVPGADSGALEGSSASVSSSDDTAVQGAGQPSIILYVSDSKGGGSLSSPQFRTNLTMNIEVRCGASSKQTAEALCDTLCDLIENALLGSHDFVALFEQIDGFETAPDYNGTDGGSHIFMADITLTGHTSERFEPTITTNLSKLNIYLGTAVDPADPPFAQIPISTE